MEYRLPHTSRTRTYNETTIKCCNFVLEVCESSWHHYDYTYTDQCKDQEEDNAFHEHTACSLTKEGDNLGVDAYDLLEGAFHGQGVVCTCADGAA